MRLFTTVMDCCGILGIQNVGRCVTPTIFWDQLIQIVCRSYVNFVQNKNYRTEGVRLAKDFSIKGAIVQINTAHIQYGAEETLKTIGFTPVMMARNTNSNNDDTVWLMKASDFWAKYKVEVAKKTNYELYPALFPEEAPEEAPASKLKVGTLR